MCLSLFSIATGLILVVFRNPGLSSRIWGFGSFCTLTWRFEW
ncbi:unnamed protein product [Brassica rapa subsp. trilocularis]